MKKLSILCLAVSLLLTASCSKEELSNETGGLYTLTGVVEENTTATRVGFDLDNNGSFFWNSGDAIAVGASSLAKYTTACNDKSTSATFTGYSQASGYAVYPWEGAQAISGNELTYKFESEYNYTTVDADFFSGMSVDMPMWAKVEGSTLAFKHLGGIFAFKFPNLKAGDNQVFTLTANSKISGVFTANLSDSEPIFETSTEGVQDADKKVTINFSLVSDADAVFYVPVPVGTYSLKVEIQNGEDTYSQEYKNLAVARRSIRYTTLSSHSLQGSEAKVVESASEVTSAMSENTNVVLNEIESQNANSTVSIELPKKSANSDVAHSLSIGSIDLNTETVEIKESTTNNEGSSISELVVSVPTTDDAKKLVIDMPNTTVTILVNGMNALTLSEVTASTADNTLVIGKGVTVNTLNVKKGNVRIEEGGKISSINRSSNNNDEVTYIIYEREDKPEITLGKDQPITLMSTGEYEFKKAIDNNATSYQISDVASFKLFRDAVNGGNTFTGCTIELINELNLNNENWTPIGFNENDEAGDEPYFSGTFDGKNHKINNLRIDVTDKGGVGLFGAVHNATFKNFTLNNVDIKAVESENDPANSSGAEGKSAYIVGGHTGAIAGYDAKSGTLNFENVHVTGLIKIEGETRAAQGQRIGGIFGGRSSSKVNFSNVSVKGSDGSYIKGYCSTAGVMGQNQNAGTFTNVQTDIDIYAVTFGAGGIVGIVRQGSTFTNCSSTGDITLDASKTQLSSYSANYPYRVGGIAGCWSESSTGVLTLTGCSYNGTLTSIDKDGNKVNSYDYAGYVGRGYTLNGCQGSKVVVNGVSYVQACNTAALSGIYIVDGVYEIGTATALKWFANEVNTGNDYFTGKTVKLTNDINLNNEEWIPIGSVSLDHGFCGNFDGNNKTIKNLKITAVKPDADGYVYIGLFGVTEGTESEENYIKNLIIENVNISSEGHIVAAAIAYPYYTTVENIIVKGDINIKGGYYTAGVLAYTRKCVNATNLTIAANSASSITGTKTVGGVISDIQMNDGLTANYSNFSASGLIITGVQCVGGISGIISSQTLDGATVENVSIKCSDARRGTISGALGGKSTIKNISVTNVTGAVSVIGATYDGSAEVVVDGDVYDKAGINK